MEPGFANSPQAAEPRLAILVETYENHVAVAFVPAFIDSSSLHTVVQNLLVNAPACKILEHGPVIRGGRRQKQMSGLFLPGDRRTGRRRDSSPAGNGLHGLHKRTALDFDEVADTDLKENECREITIQYSFDAQSGTCQLIYISPKLEETVLTENENGSVTVQLQEGANYIGLVGEDFSGSIYIEIH